MNVGDIVFIPYSEAHVWGGYFGKVERRTADGWWSVRLEGPTKQEDAIVVQFKGDELAVTKDAPVPDTVNHPVHYAHPSGVEVIEITKHESFLRGNIIKYVLRAPYKGSELEDLQKAAQYLQWEIERVQNDAV